MNKTTTILVAHACALGPIDAVYEWEEATSIPKGIKSLKHTGGGYLKRIREEGGREIVDFAFVHGGQQLEPPKLKWRTTRRESFRVSRAGLKKCEYCGEPSLGSEPPLTPRFDPYRPPLLKENR